ncbi:unnamed protein product [Rhodiola kirilowii]
MAKADDDRGIRIIGDEEYSNKEHANRCYLRADSQLDA